MRGQAHPVAARHQFENQHQDGRNPVRMEPHLRLFDDDLTESVAARSPAGWQQPVEAEKQGGEFALPGRPDEIGQRPLLPAPQDDAPLELRRVRPQLVTAEDVLFQRPAQLFVQAVLLREEPPVAAWLVLHDPVEPFAELPEHEGIADAVIGERPRRPVAQAGHALGGDEEQGLRRMRAVLRAAAAAHPGEVHGPRAGRQLAGIRTPQPGHPLAEIAIEKIVRTVAPGDPEPPHLRVDRRLVGEEFQDLEKDALARRLRTDEHRQVAEPDVGPGHGADSGRLDARYRAHVLAPCRAPAEIRRPGRGGRCRRRRLRPDRGATSRGSRRSRPR